MKKYRIQYADGPVKVISAKSVELAWDAYKLQTGKRRNLLAEQRGDYGPPVVEEVNDSPQEAVKPTRKKKSK